MSSDDKHLIADLPEEIAEVFKGDVAEVHTSEREDDVLRLSGLLSSKFNWLPT